MRGFLLTVCTVTILLKLSRFLVLLFLGEFSFHWFGRETWVSCSAACVPACAASPAFGIKKKSAHEVFANRGAAEPRAELRAFCKIYYRPGWDGDR